MVKQAVSRSSDEEKSLYQLIGKSRITRLADAFIQRVISDSTIALNPFLARVFRDHTPESLVEIVTNYLIFATGGKAKNPEFANLKEALNIQYWEWDLAAAYFDDAMVKVRISVKIRDRITTGIAIPLRQKLVTDNR